MADDAGKRANEIYDAVEQKIQAAIARGEFDNLPLEGKPLNLEENPWVPAEWRLGFKMLKDNSVPPEFVVRLKAIETIRAELEKAHSESLLRRLATKLAAEVDALNSCLLREEQFKHASLQMKPIDVEEEVRRHVRRPL